MQYCVWVNKLLNWLAEVMHGINSRMQYEETGWHLPFLHLEKF